ncbi:MAG: hypothetical protein IJF07_02825 [Lachnospiraceae bacterium]|nr:hypothetical protein [Lachnospiraceae bacterium]
MSKFEKKFGKYAIPNLTLMLIMSYVVGYIITLINSNFLTYLTLDPYQILHGQIWRIFTWVIIPPSSLDPFTIIMLFFYYNIGTTLERTWGTYRYNVYILSGMLFTVIGSFLCLGYIYLTNADLVASKEVASYLFAVGSSQFSTYYINLSIFLAFAAIYPDMQVLLFFIIPVKMKWMGILDVVLMVISFMQGGTFVKFAIVASLLNFIVYYLGSRNRRHLAPKEVKRRAEFKQQIKRSSRMTRHKCAICGKTEEDDPALEFRFCSKCNGNYEYCQNHLFTHEHVK